VIHRYGIEIEVCECFPKIPRRNARHSHRRHGLDFVKTEFQKFAVGDGVNVGVIGTCAVPGHHQGRAFVQIVHDCGMPLMKHAVHRLCGFVRLLVSITVDVHEGVSRPVGRRLAGQSGAVSFALEVAVEPVNHFVPAVGIDQHDNLFSDLLDHWLLRYGQAVRKFEHGFG